MPGNFEHRILHFEIPPPKDVWNKISNQLDEEFDPADITISKKMYDYEISPPTFLFDKVLAEVTGDRSFRRPVRIVPIAFKRVSMAAVTIGLVVISLLYFLNPEKEGMKSSTADIIPSIPRRLLIPPAATDKINIRETPPGMMAAAFNQPSNKKFVQFSSASDQDIKHISLNPVLAASPSPISVTAPPIYDANGDIIMDETLVSAPDENYIIVTSPNGEQTKISRKFLKMLCVMNSGTGNNYMNMENYQWKLRFEEWRSKLLQQASYIPTANNFLDIMDLKELLQED